MKYIILFLFVILLLTGCTNLPGFNTDTTNDEGRVPTFVCDDFLPSRGVIARFSPDTTQDVINEGEPFSLTLQFANHHKDPLIVDLILTDDSATPGFETITRSVTVEEATFIPGFQPGCRVMEQRSLPVLPLGDYVYRNVLYDHDVRFLGTLSYPGYISESTFPLCIFNPLVGAGERCSTQESIIGRSLGPTALYDPITITSVKKRLVGSSETVKIILDIHIENLGQGYVSGASQILTFHIESFEGLTFDCISKNLVSDFGGDTLDLTLTDDVADVTCHAVLSPDRTETYTIATEISYDYEYTFASKPIKLTKRTQELFDSTT